MSSTRKEEHVQLTVRADVGFRDLTTGFEHVWLPYCALPEIDFDDVQTNVSWLGHELQMPLMLTGMTGGYPDAERINGSLAEACSDVGIAMGVGSMRSVLSADADPALRASYTVVRTVAPSIPLIANVGAVQVADAHRQGTLEQLLPRAQALIDASAIAIHLNPLQEMLQPEGEPRFSGVLSAIEAAVRISPVPIIVKEVGAGISARVARSLASVGVETIDVAGAGGTSWAGVEILRRDDRASVEQFWDAGIPTATCIRQCRGIVPTLIASGGITNGTEIAKAIALGARLAGTARPALRALETDGVAGVVSLLHSWRIELRRWMFVTGSPTIDDLGSIVYRHD